MSAPTNTPKTMSDRLMTMKFMQRASASPGGREPPAKRQRLSNGSKNLSPATAPRSEASAAQALLAGEEQKRAAALEREAADRGESKWYLSFQAPSGPTSQAPLQFVSAGFSKLDSEHRSEAISSDEDEEVFETPGRKSFGKFNKDVEKRQSGGVSPSSTGPESANEDDEEEVDAEEQGEDGRNRQRVDEGVRKERRTGNKAATADMYRMGAERRKKAIDLNAVSSISSGGGSGRGGGSNLSRNASVICHHCGEKGHFMRDCPKKTKSSQSRKSY